MAAHPQELYGPFLAHYVLRFLMHQAAVDDNLDPDRLSLVQAIEAVLGAIGEFQLQLRPTLSAFAACYRRG